MIEYLFPIGLFIFGVIAFAMIARFCWEPIGTQIIDKVIFDGMKTTPSSLGLKRQIVIVTLPVAVYGFSFIVKTSPERFFTGLPDLCALCQIVFATIILGGGVPCLLWYLACFFRSKPTSIRVRSYALSAFVSIFVLIGLASLRDVLPEGLPQGSYNIRFEPLLWQSRKSKELGSKISQRSQMLGDLVHNVLPGKKRDQILELLGSEYTAPYSRTHKSDLVYDLGRMRDAGFNIKKEILEIHFDDTHRFTRYVLVHD